MKKIVSSLMVAMLCFVVAATAQVRQVTGTITDNQGNGISGVTVKVKGTNVAVAGDNRGVFRISAAPNNTLVISAVGFENTEVKANNTTINVSLVRTNNELSEVVVTTALNIKRKADNLSYATQGLKGDKLSQARQTDLNAALAGKIAGVQVRSESGAKLGATATVRLRGVNGFDDKKPLYVLDGTPISDANDINPDDVEDIQVLKGPAAAALYGQRAEAGVIMIVSKKGTRTSGLGVEVNSSYFVDKVGLLPRYQNDYSGGSWLGAGTAGTEFQKFTWDASMPAEWKPLDGKFYHLYNDDASWGPRMLGQEYIPWYAWYTGTDYTGKTAKLTPQPNNIRDFWNGNKSGQLQNGVTLSKAGDGYNFKLAFSNLLQTGLLPSTSRSKNYLSTSLSYDINKHFTAGVNVNYSNETLNGEFDDTYGNNSSGGFSQWFHRDLDMGIMKAFRSYRTPDGVLPSWNLNDGNGINGLASSNASAFLRPNYWFDHYAYFDNISNVTRRNRLVGDINLTYKFNSHFRASAFLRRNQLTSDNESKVPFVLEQSNDASSSLALSASLLGRPIKSTYKTEYISQTEDNYEFLLSYNQKFGDFGVDVNAGANDLIAEQKQILAQTKGGLTIPNLFALSNSVSPIYYTNNRYKNERRSIYGRASLNWKDLIILDGSVRNDVSSTLPVNNNSYVYPSAGLSVNLTKYIAPSLPFISFTKLRGSYAQIGSDLAAYKTNQVYTLNAALWGTNALSTTPDQQVDPNIKPTLSSSYEAGLDMRFMKNRIGLAFTYYTQKTRNQIISAPVTSTSGFTTMLINAGEIDKNGIEITIDATPVQTRNFRWDISMNMAHNNVRVISLTDQVHQLYSAGGTYTNTSGNPAYAPGAWQFDATSSYGNKYSQLIGIGIQKYNGTPVLASDGQYVPTTGNVSFGSTIPDFTGGMNNTFRYKDFTLGFSIDFCSGGNYYSLSDFWGKVSGLYDVTAGLNDKGNPIRMNVADGGGVHVTGVDATTAHNVVDKYVDAGTYYHQFYNHYINENSIYKLSYIKVREISFGYNLPVSKWGSVGSTFKYATISASVRNAFLLYSDNKNIDPSELVGGYGESGQLPPTRSIGLQLKLGF